MSILISLAAWDTVGSNNYIGAAGIIGVISFRLGHKTPLMTEMILVHFLKTFTITEEEKYHDKIQASQGVNMYVLKRAEW